MALASAGAPKWLTKLAIDKSFTPENSAGEFNQVGHALMHPNPPFIQTTQSPKQPIHPNNSCSETTTPANTCTLSPTGALEDQRAVAQNGRANIRTPKHQRTTLAAHVRGRGGCGKVMVVMMVVGTVVCVHAPHAHHHCCLSARSHANTHHRHDLQVVGCLGKGAFGKVCLICGILCHTSWFIFCVCR